MKNLRFSASIKTCLIVLICAFVSTTAYADGYSYNGDTGPGYWAGLDELYTQCGTDTTQSPIDITKAKRDKTLKALSLELLPTEVDLKNNGHTIEQEYAEGSSITVDGVEYELLQFHFHTLSEHTVKGSHQEMEMHAVFKNAESGNLVVVGQFFKLGKENDFLAKLVNFLPQMKDDVITDVSEINVAEAFKNTKSYYTYSGSLTTPPCSPIVTWIVLKKPATMSADQHKAFRDILGNNFRPIQNLNGRTVKTTRDKRRKKGKK
ncbi:MAG: carbonic anhydrase family protein [Bdellovibrionota bacterium]